MDAVPDCAQPARSRGESYRISEAIVRSFGAPRDAGIEDHGHERDEHDP
jgi:hypothetical protein